MNSLISSAEPTSDQWKVLEDFPGYLVNDGGQFYNIARTKTVRQQINNRGIVTVSLYRDGKQYVRSATLLIARAFLPPHPIKSFNTPINLNGDRSDNRVANLMWRPHGFAINYHKQFPIPDRSPDKHPAVMEIETGLKFKSTWDAAMHFGVYERDVRYSYMFHEKTVPGFHTFMRI
jgi:hypothetical protein